MNNEEVAGLMNDPVAKRLINSNIPMRLAYTALDGTPRVIPVGFHWNGAEFVVATTSFARKVAAIEANPKVAMTIDTESMPPKVLLMRGSARIEIVDDVPDEFLLASAKRVEAEGMPAFEEQVRGLYKQMAKISITPEWATIHDFETRVPSDVARLVREAQANTD